MIATASMPSTAKPFLRSSLLVGLLLANACDDEGGTSNRCEPAPANTLVTLIDHTTWRLAETAEDPWTEFRPDNIDCDAEGRKAEDFAGIMSFGVDTSFCAYTTVVQTTRAPLCAGEGLYVWLWRFALTGPEGAEAHIEVRLGNDPAWSATVPIPAESALVALTVPMPNAPYPAGTPIWFHVRNHGNNNYQLLDLARCNGDCTP
jgi:hypothetical protein